MRLEVPVDLIEIEMERALTDSESARAMQLANQVVAAFEREAFGGCTNYGFGSGNVRQRLLSRSGMVVLPYATVTAVNLVSTVDGRVLDYRWESYEPQAVYVRTPLGESVVVDYDWELVPGGGLQELLAAAVARALKVPKNVAAGVNQSTTSTGPFSQTSNYASWAVGGQVLLSPADIEAARSYRPKNMGRTVITT